jgi:hypothetical protein
LIIVATLFALLLLASTIFAFATHCLLSPHFGYQILIMPPRATRSKSSKGAAATEVEASASFTSTKSLEVDDDLHRVCILPKSVGSGTRIVYLPHPATSTPAAFVFCPESGQIFELTKVSAPKAAARSWLISAETASLDSTGTTSAPAGSLQKGYVIRNADALIATPFDPIFLLLRLFPVGKSQERNSFRLGEDYLELLSEQDPVMARLLRSEPFSKNMLKRFECICESQDIGDENVYKPSNEKLARVLVDKACRMVSSTAWPASMDEGVVKKELDIPSIPVHRAPHVETTPDDQVANASAVSGIEETLQTTSQRDIDIDVIDVMRMRKALEYLLSAYVPKALRNDIETLFKNDKIKSITPLLDPTLLQAHLDKIKAAKAEAMALRSLSDNISRKRGADDEEMADARAEKKRKKDEEDKKAKSESRNLKQLKKVDTTGMKKMSSFFAKAPAKKGQKT